MMRGDAQARQPALGMRAIPRARGSHASPRLSRAQACTGRRFVISRDVRWGDGTCRYAARI